MNEIWKVYKITQKATWEVSNYGNVKKNGEPYECVLCGAYKGFAHVYLHRAVAELFIPNPDNKREVDHIDTDRLNNNVNNLRWCTQKENNNNNLTLQHFSEANTGEKNPMYGKQHTEETKRKISEANTGEKHPMSKKCVYNNVGFGSIREAYDYAVKYDGYDKSLSTFRRHNNKVNRL